MSPATITSREFNQDTASAKRTARQRPVIITDRGKATHALLSIEEYERLQALEKPRSVIDAIGMKEDSDIDFDSFLPKRNQRPDVDRIVEMLTR